jgi:2-polyprenyl-6-methoxyphenol hydroxylase-like FAD-dependent oxidoreductase
MPNSFLPPAEQGSHHQKEGVILLGEAWNMRHPLTGGGMTVALNDVVLLVELLGQVKDLGRWDEVSRKLHVWHWRRKGLPATINILSVALYDLFGAEGQFSVFSMSDFADLTYLPQIRTSRYFAGGASNTSNAVENALTAPYLSYLGK